MMTAKFIEHLVCRKPFSKHGGILCFSLFSIVVIVSIYLLKYS